MRKSTARPWLWLGLTDWIPTWCTNVSGANLPLQLLRSKTTSARSPSGPGFYMSVWNVSPIASRRRASSWSLDSGARTSRP
uniref:Putative secreted protein n=1 Tax=Ixodes ricinus TaxID=34613 RepID=A0A6B0U5I9_IXORI